MEELLKQIDMEKIKEIVKNASKLFCDRSAAGMTKEKGLADYVTEVDINVQKFIQESLGSLYPYIQFMSEEKDNSEINKAQAVWVLDPVDGTTNLIHDYKASVISLALIKENQVIMGIVYNPYTDEMFSAKVNQGCFLNGKRVFVSNAKTMSESLISIGTSPYNKELAQKNFDIFREIYMDAQDVRRIGSAALELAYVACARSDGYFERKLKLWDYAAGMLLVKEAGGVVLDFDSKEIFAENEADVVAGNTYIVKRLYKYLID